MIIKQENSGEYSSISHEIQERIDPPCLFRIKGIFCYAEITQRDFRLRHSGYAGQAVAIYDLIREMVH